MEEEAHANPSLHVWFNDSNLGVAAALNQGFRWALDQGFDRLVVFDQDSLPASDMTAYLLAVYRAHPTPQRIAILAPQIQDSLSLGAVVSTLTLKSGVVRTLPAWSAAWI